MTFYGSLKKGMLLMLLMQALDLGAGQQEESTSLGPQRGLIAVVSKRGARVRFYRQLTPPSTSQTLPPPTTPLSMSSTLSLSPSSFPGTTQATPGSTQATQKRTGEFTFYLSELREVDADGVKIKERNDVYREFNAFDALNFNVSQLPYTFLIPNSLVSAEALTLDAALPSLFGHLNETVCLTKANGTVTSGDEVMTLIEGQLKVSVDVDRWQWCYDACTGSPPGVFFEMDVVIQLPTGSSVKEWQLEQPYGCPKRFSIGKDAWTQFSTKVLVDGTWKNVSSGYPKLSTKSSRSVITIRFPRFNSSATYDMTFDPGYTMIDPKDMEGPVARASCLGDQSAFWLVAVTLVIKAALIAR